MQNKQKFNTKKITKIKIKKTKTFKVLSIYNIKSGKYKAWRFIFIKKRIKKYN